MSTAIPLNVLVEKYIAARDRKAELKRQYDEKVAAIDAALATAEGAILAQFTAAGVESVRTAAGTAYTQLRTSCSVADWDPFLDFVRTNETWHMLERRAAKKSVEAYRDEHHQLPPGLNWAEERVVNIRRS